MNSYQIGFLYLLSYGCLFTFSLWENPPQWRTPRQTEGGIFHRLSRRSVAWFYPVGEYHGFRKFVLDIRDAFVMYCGALLEAAYHKPVWFRRLCIPLLWWIASDYLLVKWEIETEREYNETTVSREGRLP
jgi:hypothetical protein